MKIKFILIIISIFFLLNFGFSAYLWNQNKELQSDVSNISYELERLDFEALEKIRSDNSETTADDDCASAWWGDPCQIK